MGTDSAAIMNALHDLMNPSRLDHFLACAASHDNQDATGPKTWLLYVRFSEDEPQVSALADYLWGQCMYYALPRKRRLRFQEALKTDFSVIARVYQAVRDIFIQFNEDFPSRASEVGEVLAYCVVQHYLSAAQVAAKMALKTSGNMPVHGLDGIHAVYEADALTIYFLESKLSKAANDGVKDYATSAAGFLANRKQYLREYEIVTDLGHLDSLEGEAREAALEYFDIIGHATRSRRERFVGVICYSESKHFGDKIPVTDDVGSHDKHFNELYRTEYEHHLKAARKHIQDSGADPAKSNIFFVAVPDVDILRQRFYESLSGQLANQSSHSAK